MNLIDYAVPLFIFGIIIELAFGHWRGRNTYRLNDSASSIFMGVLSQARRFITLGIGGYIYYLVIEYFSLPLLDTADWWTWVLAMVMYDFCYYWLHRLGHERIILWASHVAHHQSEDYNLSTALRQTSTGFLLGWVFYIPMYMLGIPAEVVVTVGALNLLYQFWVHTEHIPKMGWYEWFFVTPSNHRVHHAQNDIYLDRNYGGLLIIWDRLFGSFQEELEDEPVIFGIRGPLKSWNPFTAITHIYRDIAMDSWHTARWRDKIWVWLARTGWRPADVAASYPREKSDLDHFQKYDPQVSRAVSLYSLFQLVSVIALLAVVQLGSFSYWPGAAAWALLLGTTVLTALWLEGRDSGLLIRWETLRLISVALCLIVAWQLQSSAVLVALGLCYFLLNLGFLWRLARGPEEPLAAALTQ
jgi:alkylglycerol monooxygenase